MCASILQGHYDHTAVQERKSYPSGKLQTNFALTSHIIKIYERILRGVMVDYVDRNELLCDNQHGFRSGRSCLTQLLSHVDDIVKGLINGADTDAIYLDFAKAFDKVDHQLLLAKMRKLGFHEKLVKWIESFLSNRKQSVVLDGVFSMNDSAFASS